MLNNDLPYRLHFIARHSNVSLITKTDKTPTIDVSTPFTFNKIDVMNNNEYFLVEHAISINLQLVAAQALPDNESTFEAEIPPPFKMASDLSQVDAGILKPLKLQHESSQALWAYLQAQNQKINTLLSYVLSQQDDQKHRYQTTHFSAGGVIIVNNQQWDIDDNLRLKLFLPDESAAIYCYAKVVEVSKHQMQINYTWIRDQDRELLIRASLHIQSQQLKARVQQREQSS